MELRVSAGSSTQAFKIKRLGLVFFNLVVANNKFHFFLRMVATQEGAKNVSYYLKIPNICNNYVSKVSPTKNVCSLSHFLINFRLNLLLGIRDYSGNQQETNTGFMKIGIANLLFFLT